MWTAWAGGRRRRVRTSPPRAQRKNVEAGRSAELLLLLGGLDRGDFHHVAVHRAFDGDLRVVGLLEILLSLVVAFVVELVVLVSDDELIPRSGAAGLLGAAERMLGGVGFGLHLGFIAAGVV